MVVGLGPNGPSEASPVDVSTSQEQYCKAGSDDKEEERARARIPLLHGKVYEPPDDKTFV